MEATRVRRVDANCRDRKKSEDENKRGTERNDTKRRVRREEPLVPQLTFTSAMKSAPRVKVKSTKQKAYP